MYIYMYIYVYIYICVYIYMFHIYIYVTNTSPSHSWFCPIGKNVLFFFPDSVSSPGCHSNSVLFWEEQKEES